MSRHDVARRTEQAGLDLVRLAQVLLGSVQRIEVLQRSMHVLQEACPGTTWVLLSRIGSGRYDATVAGEIGHEDLRRLVASSCGPTTWLCLGRSIAPNASLGTPLWCAEPSYESHDGEPEIILGAWPRPGARLPAGLDSSRLRTAAKMISSAAATSRIFEYLLDQTSRDPLTGLLNRRGILEALEREIARAGRTTSFVSALFLDLDGFKKINDRYGHTAGDRILVAVAGVLSRTLRASDALGRIGGDEFLVVLPDTGLRAAYRIGRRLAQAVRALRIQVAGQTLSISLTCGASTLEERGDGRALIDRADRKMLLRKRRRRAAEQSASRFLAFPVDRMGR